MGLIQESGSVRWGTGADTSEGAIRQQPQRSTSRLAN